MRNLFLIILLSAFSFVSKGQIGNVTTLDEYTHIGFNNNITKFHDLSYKVDDEGIKTYALHYRNMEYQNIDTYEIIFFTATDEELEYFYNFLKEGISDKVGKTIEIGNHSLFVINMGKAVRISDVTEYKAKNYFWLLPKELDRLFGKRK